MENIKLETVPTGLDHLHFLTKMNLQNRSLSESELKKHSAELCLLGTAMNALYQAGTCHRKCWGGGHVLETMVARVYNLACSSYSLISIGFYDESMNLVRSIGEIGNLIVMSVNSKEQIQEWINSDKKTRINKFSPAKVRKIIGDQALMDGEMYSNLCESYTHITANAKPNMHNSMKLSVCGGRIQPDGISKALEELVHIVVAIAMYVCMFFKYQDLLKEIGDQLKSITSGKVRET